MPVNCLSARMRRSDPVTHKAEELAPMPLENAPKEANPTKPASV